MPDETPRLSADQIQNFIKRNGDRGRMTLNILGKNTQFYKAVTSPLGEEFLKDLIFMMDEALTKIVNLQATDADMAEYRVAKKIADKWTDRINAFKRDTESIMNTK